MYTFSGKLKIIQFKRPAFGKVYRWFIVQHCFSRHDETSNEFVDKNYYETETNTIRYNKKFLTRNKGTLTLYPVNWLLTRKFNGTTAATLAQNYHLKNKKKIKRIWGEAKNKENCFTNYGH